MEELKLLLKVEVYAEGDEFQCKLQLHEGRSMALKENHPLLLEDLLTLNRKKCNGGFIMLQSFVSTST